MHAVIVYDEDVHRAAYKDHCFLTLYLCMYILYYFAQRIIRCLITDTLRSALRTYGIGHKYLMFVFYIQSFMPMFDI